MSKKARPQVQFQTQTTSMPDYVVDAQKNMLGSAQSILNPYLNAGQTGYGIAGFNQDQNDAFDAVRGMAADAQANGGLNPNEINPYLNPYTQQVVDTSNQTLRDESERNQNAIRARTAAGSSFGGSNSRGFLMEAEENRNLDKQIASNTAALMAQGYDKATATALAAQGLKQQSVQGLLNVGNQEQELEQSKLDVPLNALQRLAAVTPQQYGSTTSGTTVTQGGQQQSPLQTLLGGALAIGGMRGTDGASLLSNGLGALGGLFGLSSDRDDKTDIQRLGKDPATGLDLFSYRYKSDPKSYPKVVGPMAQQVEKVAPGSTRRIGGHLVITGA